MSVENLAKQIDGATYRSTQDIMDMYRAASPKAPELTKDEKMFFALLNQAKKQHGSKFEKIEMVMRYQSFESEQQETEAFAFLLERLED